MKRRDEVSVGILITVSVIVLVLGTLWLARGGLKSGYPLYTRFGWGQNLKQGQPVLLAGVSVGYVGDVTLRREGYLDVLLRIDDKYTVPKGSKATVKAIGIFGDVAIALTPPIPVPATSYSRRRHRAARTARRRRRSDHEPRRLDRANGVGADEGPPTGGRRRGHAQGSAQDRGVDRRAVAPAAVRRRGAEQERHADVGCVPRIGRARRRHHRFRADLRADREFPPDEREHRAAYARTSIRRTASSSACSARPSTAMERSASCSAIPCSTATRAA